MFELKIEPMTFGIYNCPAGWAVNEKGAVFHRLYFVYGGEAFYSDNYTGFALEASHIYLFPVNTPYTIAHNPDNPFRCLYFHISTRPLILDRTIDIDTQEYPAVSHMIKTLELIAENIDKYPDYSSLLPQLLNGLVMIFNSISNLSFSDGNRLQQVIDYIHSHVSERITNVRLASIAGFNHYYFARLFRRTFGVSPQEYISNYRFTKAQILLRNSMPVKQVAELVGYQDQKSFSRAFKKAMGCPPSQYIKSHSLQP